MPSHSLYPKRIVCLSHDAVENLFALQVEAHIVEPPGAEVLQPGPCIVEGRLRLKRIFAEHGEAT